MSASTDQKALIIMAHGSRRESANQEFFALVTQLQQQNDNYGQVIPALLEQAPPTLLQASLSLPDTITEIDVYPLFFNQGKHVEKDIPAQVAEVMEQFPQKTIRLLPYFGSSPDLSSLMLKHIAEVSI